MRVASNSYSNSLLQLSQKQLSEQIRLQRELASGQSIRQGSDDSVKFQTIKEIQSSERAMIAYRSNLYRAQFVADITDSNLDSLRDISKDVLNATNIMETGVNDKPQMLATANLIDELIEQALEILNTKNGEEHLFSGSSTKTTPYEVSRDSDSQVATKIQKASGATTDPTLVSGQLYQILDITNVDFTAGGAAANTVGTVFTYNGGTIDWGTGGDAALAQVKAAITETTQDDLVVGRAYEISSLGTSSDFTDSGAISNTDGLQFIYNGTTPTWGGAELIPLNLSSDEDTRVTGTTALGSNKLYKIGINAMLGTPLPDVVKGDTITDGKIYRVEAIDDSKNLSSIGGPSSAEVGDTFVADFSGSTTTHAIDGLTLKQMTFQLENSALAAGSVLSEGDTVMVTTDTTTNGTDFSSLGGPTANANDSVGKVFTVTTAGTVPTGSTVTRLIASTAQTAAPLDAGETYVVADTSINGTKTFNFGDEANLEVGTTYTIANNGSNADFSDNTGTGGTGLSQPDEGTIFTTGTDVTNYSPTFGDAILVEVGGDGTPITDVSDMQASTSYQVVDNGTTSDFIRAGAQNNNVGTSFVYNGTPPDMGNLGQLTLTYNNTDFSAGGGPIAAEQITSATSGNLVSGRTYTITAVDAADDFTNSGASSNTVGETFVYNGTAPTFTGTSTLELNTNGTLFTANGSDVDFGESGKVYQLFADRHTSSSFTSSGAKSNSVGTVFTYNGTTPTFGDDNGDGAMLLTYERERLATAYVGGGAEMEFLIAEGKKMSPYNSVKWNAKYIDFVNNLVHLRDAFTLAGNAQGDDQAVTQSIAMEAAKDAYNRLDEADDDILESIAELGIKKIDMAVAESRDDLHFKNKGDLISERMDVDSASLITMLNQNIETYEGSLQSSARILNMTLLNYI